MNKILLASLVLLLARAAWSDPSAAPTQDLRDQIAQIQASRLDHDTKIATALAELQKMQGDMQAVNGNQETVQHQLDGIQRNIERQNNDISVRLQVLEDEMKLYEEQIIKALQKVAPAVAEESKLFQKGLDEVKANESLAAIATFQQYVKKYTSSKLLPEAYFWLGESRFSLHKFEEAIKDYQQVVSKYPQSDKAPAALFKQGESFAELNMKEEAKTFWQKLVKDYPGSEQATQAKTKLEGGTATATPSATPVPTTPPPKAPFEY